MGKALTVTPKHAIGDKVYYHGRVWRQAPCPRCDGKGVLYTEGGVPRECVRCHGTGESDVQTVGVRSFTVQDVSIAGSEQFGFRVRYHANQGVAEHESFMEIQVFTSSRAATEAFAGQEDPK